MLHLRSMPRRLRFGLVTSSSGPSAATHSATADSGDQRDGATSPPDRPALSCRPDAASFHRHGPPASSRLMIQLIRPHGTYAGGHSAVHHAREDPPLGGPTSCGTGIEGLNPYERHRRRRNPMASRNREGERWPGLRDRRPAGAWVSTGAGSLRWTSERFERIPLAASTPSQIEGF